MAIHAQAPTTSRAKIGLGCGLSIEQSPSLRGFRLGQTYREVTASIPNYSVPRNLKVDDLKIIHLTSLDNYEDLKEDDRFADVTITWQFFDDKLFRLFVGYSDFRPASLSDFLRQFNKTSGIPVESFRRTSPYEAIAECVGFSAEASTARLYRAGWNRESNVILEDLEATAEIDRRDKERVRAEKERERKEIQERKRREQTFKP